jgi:hypothetical protein
MFSLFVYKGEFLGVLGYHRLSFLFRARVGFLSELCRSFALGVVRDPLSSTILLFSFVSIKHPISLITICFLIGYLTVDSLIGSMGSYQIGPTYRILSITTSRFVTH